MKWTEQDISKLRELAYAEKTNAQIAEAMGIPIVEVYAKRSHLGLTIAKIRAAKGGEGSVKAESGLNGRFQKENPTPEAQGLNQKDMICLSQHFKAYFYQSNHKEVASWGKPCEDCPLEPDCHGKWGDLERKLHDITGLELKRVIRNRPFDPYFI